MSDKDYTGIVICGETVSIDIMLPERDTAGPSHIKEAIEEELKVKVGNMFIPFNLTREGSGIDFGKQGRRWHIRAVIDMSQREEFYNSLRIFCKQHKLSFNGISHSSIR